MVRPMGEPLRDRADLRVAGPAADIVQEAVGVDVSLGMLTQARSLARGLSNVRFVEADSGRLPFEEQHFTALLCTTSFHHYSDPASAVREMARVLGRGGR